MNTHLLLINQSNTLFSLVNLLNIRVTTKVAVNALLGDTPNLVNYGSALMANLGDKEVKAVVCILQL